MLCSSLSRDYCGIDEKSLKKQPSMLSSGDQCRLDKNVEKFIKKQPSKRLWSDLFKNHRRLDDVHDWSIMLVEILEQISDRLPTLDFLRFRSVRKQWRSSPSSRAELLLFSKDHPWLILYDPERNKTGIPKCYIYTQFHPQCCTFKLYDLEGATVVESKFGWLLAHHGQFFFLYNPFTFSRVNLPELNISGDYSCTFTYLPTRRECTVCILNRMNDSSLNLSRCRVGDKEWSTQTISDISYDDMGRSMRVSTCNHTDEGLCNHLCPSAKMYNKIMIYDPEKKNKMRYKFLKNEKVFVYDYWKVEWTAEYKQEADKLKAELTEMRSKHEKEWWQRSGGRDISVTFVNKHPGTFSVRPPEATKFDVVKASFLQPKSSEIWFKLLWD